jgi:glycosyltransferase involved in cell wall biosynthesis
VALIGNSPPRQCGIATFTSDLADALEGCGQCELFVLPVNDVSEGYDYPPRVWFELAEKDIASYRRAADFLNINNVDVVNVQHEYGIFGGAAGSHLLALLRELRMPVVTTLHTVLEDPDAQKRRVMDELSELSDKIVALTRRSAVMLREVHGVPNHKIELIPHGVHDVPFVDPSFFKDKFGVAGRKVLLTFGLIGPGKGIEFAVEALPAITRRHPDAVYIVLGATHPTLRRQQGESYRLGLERLARQLGVEASIIFHNRFVTLPELIEFLGAADIYLTPYLNMEQVCSGTLAYAVGAGKAVVSTPYWHAEELLADERGVLIAPRDPQAIAEAVTSLLDDPVRRDSIRKRAYMMGREMIWSKIGRRYLEAFERARESRTHRPRPAPRPSLDRRPAELPILKLDHLLRMTDGTGMLQHATYCVPRYGEGYTTDDNARALLFTVLAEEVADDAVARLSVVQARYMSFVDHAFNERRGRFRNFLSHDRRWLEEAGSEDSQGRALWALGTVVARGRLPGMQEWAAQLFQSALVSTSDFTSPRAWAFTLLGIERYLTRYSGDRIAQDLRRVLAERLLDQYRACRGPGWLWFEDSLTYSNARLPQAVIASRDAAGVAASPEEILEVALESLRWLREVQTAEEGHFVPIGCNGFYPRGGERARFDQQPVEAHAMVSACLEALRASGDRRWWVEAQRAFDWFVGRNDLRTAVYNPATGGCYDAILPDHVSSNQGAESTLSFLISLVEMRLAQAEIDVPAREAVAVV